MDVAERLWASVAAAHAAVGAPMEAFDAAASQHWHYVELPGGGILGFMPDSTRDGDFLVVSLPSPMSFRASNHTLLEMAKYMERTGRVLYTMAHKNHLLALNINQHIGGELLGVDEDGYYHFKHTLQGLRRGKRVVG